VLFWLGERVVDHVGPARLLTSRLFLGGLGAGLCFTLTFLLLPRLMHRASVDRGKEHAVDGEGAKGKPTGTGVIFIPVFVTVQFLCLPLTWKASAVLALTLGAMVFGYLDDRARLPWSEYRKGLFDLVLAAAAATALSGLHAAQVWLPFVKGQFEVPAWAFIVGGTALIWLATNALNCSDGIDSLSATLSLMAFSALGGLLYVVLGNERIANYLLVPIAPYGAVWGMLAFSVAGTLLGYLWYNAPPSILLMGDAGSRAIGFLLGVLVITTGNPFMLLIVSAVLLANGGTGLVKVALLRFGRISIFKTVRFPLHDHVRHNKHWSNTQVLVRFSALQLILTAALLLVLLKIR
jgi:phospho-N-acetylmuramoyl-pentapeptide-transferase